MRRVAARIAGITGCVALVATVSLVLVSDSGSVAAEALAPSVKPAATLSAGQSVVLTNTTPLVGDQEIYPPSACRGHAGSPDESVAPLTCKAYRIVLNLDPDPKAENTVFIEADFNQTQLQSLPLVALGLNPPPVNGLDVYVWDQEDHWLGENAPGTLDPVTGPGDPTDEPPGSASFNEPERGGFTAKQRIYDITVQADTGVNQGYELHLTFSNEIFTPPHEVLDQFGNTAAPSDTSSPEPTFTPPADTSSPAPTIALPEASVAPDQDIAGIGLGTTQEFNPNGFALPPRTRDVAATATPPSGAALVLGLVAFPFAAAGVGVLALRRRRQALLT
ncbi:MAG TPA: hypothetical protein VHD87_16115 [Acidimicrobiales bacterium]|nr:hypothetical protein [Acidimicrobiales bacterium]